MGENISPAQGSSSTCQFRVPLGASFLQVCVAGEGHRFSLRTLTQMCQQPPGVPLSGGPWHLGKGQGRDHLSEDSSAYCPTLPLLPRDTRSVSWVPPEKLHSQTHVEAPSWSPIHLSLELSRAQNSGSFGGAGAEKGLAASLPGMCATEDQGSQLF